MRRPAATIAETLRVDLLARGFVAPPLGVCEAIAARLIERAMTDNKLAADDAPPRRCDTNEVDLDGSCMACGAIEGEACQKPEARQ